MPPFLIFVLVLAGIWTLSGITTWLGKQKEAERRQRLREQMARAGVNVPIAPPAFSQGVQTPRQISAAIANRFPDVLLPPSPQRPPQRIQQRRPPQPRPLPPRPAQSRPFQKRPQPAGRQQTPAAPTLSAPAAVIQQAATGTVVVQAAGKPPVAPLPRMSAASLARWMNPRTLNQQFLLSEIFQPPLGIRDRGPGM